MLGWCWCCAGSPQAPVPRCPYSTGGLPGGGCSTATTRGSLLHAFSFSNHRRPCLKCVPSCWSWESSITLRFGCLCAFPSRCPALAGAGAAEGRSAPGSAPASWRQPWPEHQNLPQPGQRMHLQKHLQHIDTLLACPATPGCRKVRCRPQTEKRASEGGPCGALLTPQLMWAEAMPPGPHYEAKGCLFLASQPD